MSDDKVPELPKGETSSDYRHLYERLSQLEDKLAEGEIGAEARHRNLLIKEVEQRIQFRGLVLCAAVAVVFIMFLVMAHGMHKIMFWDSFLSVPEGYAIVLIAAPTVSITTITVALLVGSFRRFKDDDSENVSTASLISEAGKAAIQSHG